MFFQNGFRPFFLGAGLWAAFSILLWMLAYFGPMDLSSGFFPLAWHVHEMLFGYTAAVIGGFLLTAVPNWTGVTPLRGGRLVLIFGAWVLGRLVIFFSALIPPLIVAVVDLSFLVALLGYATWAIVSAGNKRNLVVAALLGLLVLANALMHAEVAWESDLSDLGGRLGIGTIVMLVTLIGGRVVPNFTQNWLRKRGHDDPRIAVGWVDKATMALTAVTFLVWVFRPDITVLGLLFALCGLLGLLRLAGWRTKDTFAEPLVTILHVAYVWLPIGSLLMAGSYIFDGLPQTTALHGLTVGAIGTMTLAVMTRASLGHTGRELTADRSTVAIFGLITLAAILRVGSTLGPDPLLMTSLSGVAWIGAYSLFTISYGPMFFRARAE